MLFTASFVVTGVLVNEEFAPCEGIWVIFACGNPKSWALESGILLKESGILLMISLCRRRNLIPVSNVCESAPISLFWAPNGLNKLPVVRFKFPHLN